MDTEETRDTENPDAETSDSPPESAEVERVEPAEKELALASSFQRSLTVKTPQVRLPAEIRRHKNFIRFLLRSIADRKLVQHIEKLRDSILRQVIESQRNTTGLGSLVGIAGAEGREGTSWISLILTLSLGDCTHRRIALLDCTFDQTRFESVAKVLRLDMNDVSIYFGRNEMCGFHSEAQPNTYFLCTSDETSGLSFFSDKKLPEVLDELRERFDIVICDMPPLLDGSANVFLTPLLDHLYLVAAPGKIKHSQMSACIKAATIDGKNKISGVILNKQRAPFWTRLFARDYFF